MELSRYISTLRKNWLLVTATGILGVGAGAGLSLLMTPEYESSTQLYVSVRPSDGNTTELVQGANYSQNIIDSYVAVIETDLVLDPVVEELQLDTTNTGLSTHVSATSPIDSVLIDITATSPSADEAAAIANSVGESFKDIVGTRLGTQAAGWESPVTLTTTQEARVPGSPVGPNVLNNLALGLLAGLALGGGIALFRALLDRRIHSINDIGEITNKPLLGRIIDDREANTDPLGVSSKPRSSHAESFRVLRTNLQFIELGSSGHTYVVTSPGPDEGKTSTSLNLAFSLAQTGARVAVLEGDLRRPMFSEYLGIEGGAGLTDVLVGRADLEDVLQRWGRDQVFVLPAGRIPPNPSELLGSAEMEKTLGILQETFDYVIIDTPPALAVTDAAVLGKQATGLLVVVATDSTTKQRLAAALRELDTAGAEVLGLVATRVPAKASGGYGYGYDRYGDSGAAEAPAVTSAPEAVGAPETRREPKRPLEKMN